MTIIDLGLVGSNSNKTSGTTLAITNSSGATIPKDALLVLSLTFDNHASATAATLSLSTGATGAWTQRGTTTGSGVTTTAGTGIWGASFTVRTNAAIANGATITTITFGSSVVAKAAIIEGFTGVQNTLRNTVVTGTSTTGSPTATTSGTALVTGDLVYGSAHGENNANPTADADTLNGSWDTLIALATTGSTANTNVCVGGQDKVVTATGAQTYNPTGMVADSVAFVYALVPDPDIATTDTASIAASETSSIMATLFPASTDGAAVSASESSSIKQFKTRFFFASTGTTPVSPTPNAGWDVTGSQPVRPLLLLSELGTGSSANDTALAETATTTVNRIKRQHVSQSSVLLPHTISGDFRLVLQPVESAGALAMIQAIIYVVDSTGTTVRGVLYSGQTAGSVNSIPGDNSQEMGTTLSSRVLSGTVNPVAAQVGDYIVVELGGRFTNTSAISASTTFRINDQVSATDMDFRDGITSTTLRTWIEFEDDIYQPPVPIAGTESVAVTATESSDVLDFTPNAVQLGQVSAAQNKSAGTSLAYTNTSGSTIPAGTLLALGFMCDSGTSISAPVVSFTGDATGGTWAQFGGTQSSGISGAAGLGIWGFAYWVITTSSIAPGAAITTLNLDYSVVAKSGTISGWSGHTGAGPRGVSGASGASGPPAVTTTESANLGDIVVGVSGTEQATIPTGDSDTVAGAWDAIVGSATAGSTGSSNVAVAIQSKVPTDGGTQAFNPSASNDSFSIVGIFPGGRSAVGSNTPVNTTDTSAITATETSDVLVQISSTDTAAITASETSSSFGTMTSTETVAVTASEVSSPQVNEPATDGAAITASESATIVVQISSTDTAAVSASESSSISGTTASADTSAITASETRTLVVSQPTTDTASVSASEASSVLVLVSTTDTAAITATETSSPQVNVNTTDTAAVSAAETSTPVISLSRTDTAAITASESVATTVGLSSTDAAAITATETDSIAGTVSSTDTSAITANDAAFVNSGSNPSGTDTVAVIASEQSSISSLANTTDTASIAASETSSVLVQITSTDSCAITASESVATMVGKSTTDTAAISASETSGIAVAQSSTDGAAISASESVATTVYRTTTDTSAIAATENVAISGTLSATDTAAVSASEQASGFVSVTASDNVAITAVENDTLFLDFTSTDTVAISITESTSIDEHTAELILKVAEDMVAISITEETRIAILYPGINARHESSAELESNFDTKVSSATIDDSTVVSETVTDSTIIRKGGIETSKQ